MAIFSIPENSFSGGSPSPLQVDGGGVTTIPQISTPDVVASSPSTSIAANRLNREVIYGERRVSGKQVVPSWVSGANSQFTHFIIALAGHEVDEIGAVYIGDHRSDWYDQFNIANLYRINKHLGSTTQAADTDLVAEIPNWTTAHQLKGIAYIYVRILFDKNVFPGAIPQITVDVRGRKCYDPRDASTIWSDNWALCCRDYLTNTSFGIGAPASIIDDTAITAAANICDELVAQLPSQSIASITAPPSITITSITASTAGYAIIRTSANHGLEGLWRALKAWPDIKVDISGHSNAEFNGTFSVLTSHTLDLLIISGTFTSSGYGTGGTVSVSASSATLVTLSDDVLLAPPKFLGNIEDHSGNIIVNELGQSLFLSEFSAIEISGVTGSSPDINGHWFAALFDANKIVIPASFSSYGTGGSVGVATERRYTCNGIIDTGAEPVKILGQLLTAAAGSLSFTEGKWQLKAASYDTPTITLTESDLRGDIRIQATAPRRALFNAVKGVYTDPTQNWDAVDFPAITNSTYETEDGSQIVKNIQLPFTTNGYMAQRIAKILLEQNRQQISVVFPANFKNALRLKPGMTVMVSISRLGWTSKVFKVVMWKISPPGGIDLTLKEEASGVYDWVGGYATRVDLAANTNLASPLIVEPPTGLTATSGTAELLKAGDGTIISRIKVSWTASADQYVTGYELTYNLESAPNDETSIIISPDKTTFYITPAQDGVSYEIQLKAKNDIGVLSPAAKITHTPTAVTASVQATMWFQRTSNLTNQTLTVIASNGSDRVMIAGSGRKVSTSIDGGATWDVSGDVFPAGTVIKALVYGGGTWVAAGQDNDIFTSTDGGVTWTTRTSPWASGGIFTGAAYDGTSRFILVGSGFGAGADNFMYSTDAGVTWTSGSFASMGNNGNEIAYGGGTWVAVGASGAVETSTNGTSFTARTSGQTAALVAVAYDSVNSKWVIAGNKKISTSTDAGVTWTAQTDIAMTGFYAVAHNGAGLWIGTGTTQPTGWVSSPTDKHFAYSRDGETWTGIFVDWPRGASSGTINSIVFHDGAWIAVGNNGSVDTCAQSLRYK